MVFPKIFFLYLDDDKDDACVCNELFEYLKVMLETSGDKDEYIEIGMDGIAHIIFLDRDTESESAEKINRLTTKLKVGIKLLVQTTTFQLESGGEEITGNYQLAVKSQKSKSNVSITLYFKKIEEE